MAAAEQLVIPLASITTSATPFGGGEIQGSTQPYEFTIGSPMSGAAIFFAQPQVRDEFWGSFGIPTPKLYSLTDSGNRPSLCYSVVRARSFEWERLSLELMRIASLEPNWDGEGGEPVSQTTVTTTAVMLTLARSTVEHFLGSFVSMPTLFPTTDGGIALRWIRGKKELKCTVETDTIEVVRWRSLDRYGSEGIWEIPVRQVGEHFEWLLHQ